jgi:hypothetical protein
VPISTSSLDCRGTLPRRLFSVVLNRRSTGDHLEDMITGVTLKYARVMMRAFYFPSWADWGAPNSVIESSIIARLICRARVIPFIPPPAFDSVDESMVCEYCGAELERLQSASV